MQGVFIKDGHLSVNLEYGMQTSFSNLEDDIRQHILHNVIGSAADDVFVKIKAEKKGRLRSGNYLCEIVFLFHFVEEKRYMTEISIYSRMNFFVIRTGSSHSQRRYDTLYSRVVSSSYGGLGFYSQSITSDNGIVRI
jgi:hypothetical protein